MKASAFNGFVLGVSYLAHGFEACVECPFVDLCVCDLLGTIWIQMHILAVVYS